MKFRTQKTGWQEVDSFGPVASALAGLGWRKKDDSYLCLEEPIWGFTQVANYRAGQYIAEWRTPPTGKLVRAQAGKVLGRIVHRGKRKSSQFPIYKADLLKLEDGMDILLTFWLRSPRPRRYVWRDLTPRLKRYLKLKASGKVK
jgi:hypothetical protein